MEGPNKIVLQGVSFALHTPGFKLSFSAADALSAAKSLKWAGWQVEADKLNNTSVHPLHEHYRKTFIPGMNRIKEIYIFWPGFCESRVLNLCSPAFISGEFEMGRMEALANQDSPSEDAEHTHQ